MFEYSRGYLELSFSQFYVVCQNKEDKFQSLANLYGTIYIGLAMAFTHVSEGGNVHVASLQLAGPGYPDSDTRWAMHVILRTASRRLSEGSTTQQKQGNSL